MAIQLPYELIIPYPVRHFKILDFSPQDSRQPDDAGAEDHDLESPAVTRACQLKRDYGRLSANDGFCMVTVEQFVGAILRSDAIDRRSPRTGTSSLHRGHILQDGHP